MKWLLFAIMYKIAFFSCLVHSGLLHSPCNLRRVWQLARSLSGILFFLLHYDSHCLPFKRGRRLHNRYGVPLFNFITSSVLELLVHMNEVCQFFRFFFAVQKLTMRNMQKDVRFFTQFLFIVSRSSILKCFSFDHSQFTFNRLLLTRVHLSFLPTLLGAS